MDFINKLTGKDDDDIKGAADHASHHAGSSGNAELFSQVLGLVTQKKSSLADEDIDEDDAVNQHKRFFGSGSSGDDHNADDKSLGSAAAMQALKMYTGSSSGSSSSGGQSAFVGLAMAEASKLFDEKSAQGKVSGDASKESAVAKAGEMALKMYLKGQGGGASSGPGGLLGLASKFIK